MRRQTTRITTDFGLAGLQSLAALCVIVVAQALSGPGDPPERFEAAHNAWQPDRIEASLDTSGFSAIRVNVLRLLPERVADRETRSGDGAANTSSRAFLPELAVHGQRTGLRTADETPHGPLYHLHRALLI